MSDSTDKAPKPTEFNVTLHGEIHHIQITGTGHHSQLDRPFYMTVDGVPEEVLIETLSSLEGNEDIDSTSIRGSKRPKATAPGDVTTSMPGTVIEVLVAVGDKGRSWRASISH